MLEGFKNVRVDDYVVNDGGNMSVEDLRELKTNFYMQNSMLELEKNKEADMSNIHLFINAIYYENHFKIQEASSKESEEMLKNRHTEASMKGLSGDLLCYVYMHRDLEKNTDIVGFSISGRKVLLKNTIDGVPSISSILVTMRRIIENGGIRQLQEQFVNNEMAFEISENNDIFIFPECLSSRAQDIMYKIEKEYNTNLEITNKEAENVQRVLSSLQGKDDTDFQVGIPNDECENDTNEITAMESEDQGTYCVE